MGNRLATIDMGRKEGRTAVPLSWGRWQPGSGKRVHIITCIILPLDGHLAVNVDMSSNETVPWHITLCVSADTTLKQPLTIVLNRFYLS